MKKPIISIKIFSIQKLGFSLVSILYCIFINKAVIAPMIADPIKEYNKVLTLKNGVDVI